MCVLCVQSIASCQSMIEDPDTDEWIRDILKNNVLHIEKSIQNHKLRIDEYETEIEAENEGESII